MGRKAKVDINHAAPEDIEILAGVGHDIARSIVAYRVAHPFRDNLDLQKIPGIDKASLLRLTAVAWYAPVAEAPEGDEEQRGDGRININHADASELMSIPNVGERSAETIIDYRRQHGAFKSLEDVDKIPGFGPRMMENLKDRIFFGD